MKHHRTLVIAIALTFLAACHSHQRPAQPGLYNTRAEAQTEADKANALTQKQRAALKSFGVHEQYLPCGAAKPVPTPTGYWMAQTDKIGCPPTTGEEDPDPNLSGNKVKSESGGQQ
jgi:hypothetical protein